MTGWQMSQMAKVIVVEDEANISEAIVAMLQQENHTVDTSFDGYDAWERLQSYEYDLVILDWGLQGLDGFSVLSKFRAKGGKTPVLFLTGRGSIQDKIQGLDAGADDYLPKPFDLRELQSRVRALLRRPAQLEDRILKLQDLELDQSGFRCLRDGVDLKLQKKEFALLQLLVRNPNKVYTYDQLIDRVWSGEADVSIDAIRQMMRRLRAKIDLPGQPSYITTVVGVGYKVEATP